MTEIFRCGLAQTSGLLNPSFIFHYEFHQLHFAVIAWIITVIHSMKLVISLLSFHPEETGIVFSFAMSSLRCHKRSLFHQVFQRIQFSLGDVLQHISVCPQATPAKADGLPMTTSFYNLYKKNFKLIPIQGRESAHP